MDEVATRTMVPGHRLALLRLANRAHSGKVAHPAPYPSIFMPRLILTCLVLAILFCLLCGPVTYVALRLWRRGDLGAFKPLRVVWVVQVALASALIFAADSIGLQNPIGYVIAIVLAVSVTGAAAFGAWRLMLRALLRSR